MKKFLLPAFILIFSISHASVTVTDTIKNACNGSSTGSVALGASGGTAPYTYKQGTGSYQSSNTFTGLTAGSYTFYAKDANGSTGSISATIHQSSSINISGTVDTTTSTITTTETGGTPSYTYYWPGWWIFPSGTFFNDSSYIQGGSYPQQLLPGNYYIVVTDQYGCTAAKNFIVPGGDGETLIAVFKSPSCYAAVDYDSIILIPDGGAPGSYPVAINNGYPTGFTGQLDYPFTYTGPGYISATLDGTLTITEPYGTIAPISTRDTSTNCTAKYSNDGTISVSVSGGQQPYKYTWSGGGGTSSDSSLSNLAPGNYSVTITDAGGCSVIRSWRVIGPPILSESTGYIHCYGGHDGTVSLSTLHGVAPYQYRLAGGSLQSSGQFTQFSAGTYQFYVSDSLGEEDSLTVQFTQPNQLVVSGYVYNDTVGLNDGEIYVSGAGGTGSYSYVWNTGSTSSTIFSLVPGIYIVTVIDGNGCMVSDTFTVQGVTGIPTINNLGFDLYPDPNQGKFTLATTGSRGKGYTVSDMLGHIVSDGVISSDIQSIDMTEAPDGIYVITISGRRPRHFIVTR